MLSRRAWVPVLGWCAATLGSIAVGTVALQPLLRTAAPAVAVAPDAPPAVAVQPAPTPVPTAAPSRRTAPPKATPSATVVDGWTLTIGADGVRTYLRSFRVDGGQAVIRMTPGRVRLVTATPAEGYAVDTAQSEPDNLAVQFTEQDHYFVIHALWHNDAPFADVREVGG
jgi:hypothetical protein